MQQAHYLFQTERLGYRPIMEADFDDYLRLDSNAEIRQFFPNGTLDADRVRENMQKKHELFQKKWIWGIYCY